VWERDHCPFNVCASMRKSSRHKGLFRTCRVIEKKKKKKKHRSSAPVLPSSQGMYCDRSGGNVKRFRGGLVFKAHRLVYHSTLGLKVITRKKKSSGVGVQRSGVRAWGPEAGGSGWGTSWGGLGVQVQNSLRKTLRKSRPSTRTCRGDKK